MTRVFAGVIAEGGVVKALRLPNGARVSNSRVKPKGDVAGEHLPAGHHFSVEIQDALLLQERHTNT